MASWHNRAILLDRDGVINVERADYVKHWREFEFLPGVLSALKQLAQRQWPIVVISNQSAIGRGYVSLVTVTEIHEQMRWAVVQAGGRIDEVFICPHHPDDGCECRKPKPGMLLQAAAKYRFSLANSVFVGDMISDFQAAQAAGCQSILVESGRQGLNLHTMFSSANMTPPIVRDLRSAVELIMEQ